MIAFRVVDNNRPDSDAAGEVIDRITSIDIEPTGEIIVRYVDLEGDRQTLRLDFGTMVQVYH